MVLSDFNEKKNECEWRYASENGGVRAKLLGGFIIDFSVDCLPQPAGAARCHFFLFLRLLINIPMTFFMPVSSAVYHLNYEQLQFLLSLF